MDEAKWILLREYASQFEADLDLGVLEHHGVPFQVQGPPIGVFGPGFSGSTAAGVRVMVPSARADEAAALLEESDEPGEAGAPES